MSRPHATTPQLSARLVSGWQSAEQVSCRSGPTHNQQMGEDSVLLPTGLGAQSDVEGLIYAGEAAEVDRACWVCFVRFLQTLNPEMSPDLERLTLIGQYPLQQFQVSAEAKEFVEWGMASVWGESSLVVTLMDLQPRNVFHTKGTGMSTRGIMCNQVSGLAVKTVLNYVDTCSPVEKRVINVKAQYHKVAPTTCVEMALNLYNNWNGLWKTPVVSVPHVASRPIRQSSVKRMTNLRLLNLVKKFAT